MNTITINGTTIRVQGNNVVVSNRQVIVDGKVVYDNTQSPGNEVTVKWEGDLAKLNCTDAVIYGDIQGNVDSTNLTCQSIGGDVTATNVTCKGDIQGRVNAVNVSYKKN